MKADDAFIPHAYILRKETLQPYRLNGRLFQQVVYHWSNGLMTIETIEHPEEESPALVLA